MDEQFTNDKEAEFFHQYKRRRPKPINEKLMMISDGCELVLLNKHNFMLYADVDTLCKIEQMEDVTNTYMSDDGVREHLRDREKWDRFKRTVFHSVANETTKAKHQQQQHNSPHKQDLKHSNTKRIK